MRLNAYESDRYMSSEVMVVMETLTLKPELLLLHLQSHRQLS